MNEPEFGFDWALEAGSGMKKYILSNDYKQLINYNLFNDKAVMGSLTMTSVVIGTRLGFVSVKN
jgi:hypothetical protein